MHAFLPIAASTVTAVLLSCSSVTATTLSVADFPSIQSAIDANPGRRLLVPNGDWILSSAVRIRTDNTGLYGPGRLIQQNPKAGILRIDDAKGVRISDITLTRPPGAQDATEPAIEAVNCTGLEIADVRASDNHFGSGSFLIRQCTNATVRNCTVENYKTVTMDDRTYSPLMGYAFKCVDGTGIQFSICTGTLCLYNRIIESNLLPTKEVQAKYDLGRATIIPEKKGSMTPESIYKTGYTNNWHQGSGLIASNGGRMHNTIITGNYIENAAQGMDIHGDQAIVAGNLVTHVMAGMKAVHGSCNTLIHSNIFNFADLYCVGLGPAVASTYAVAATTTSPAVEANIDGESIIANNIMSGSGRGDQYWNWSSHGPEGRPASVIGLGDGQLPENPNLRDVIIAGNVVYNSEKERNDPVNGDTPGTPHYRWAVRMAPHNGEAPKGIQFFANILQPGTSGTTSNH